MRNLLILLFFVVGIQSTKAQMLEEGNQWIYEIRHWSPLHFAYVDTTIETLTVTGDTVLNGVNYQQLVFTRRPPCLNSEPVEYLRQEGDRIWRFNREYQTEYLMIDYGETAGYELIYVGYDLLDTGIVFIDSFGIVTLPDGSQLEAQYMRILNNQSYDDYAAYTVFRDIGFINPGTLFPDVGTGLCDAGSVSQFRCFVSGQDTFHFTEYDCFEIPLINSTKDLEIEQAILFPNPATDYVVNPYGLHLTSIINLAGQSITIQYQEENIDVSNFPPGYYILRFVDIEKGKTYIGSIVIN